MRCLSEFEWKELEHSLANEPATLFANNPALVMQARLQDKVEGIYSAKSFPTEPISGIKNYLR